MLDYCRICPRGCGVNRISGELGYCGQGAVLTAARAYLHAWEEPCISGEHGSGTVFFSGCNMRCVFCQNHEIASGEVKKEISAERLVEIFIRLQEERASNINLVTPTHFVPLIIPALEAAKRQGLHIPVVYNTSAYENVDTLKALEGLVDIYLPDCKYYSEKLSMRYSNAPGYFGIAMDAIEEMLRQVHEPLFMWEKKAAEDDRQLTDMFGAIEYNRIIEELSDDDYSGPLMKSGVIVRHLMLPGQLSDSKKVIKELLSRFGDKVYLSIMNQFTPYGDLSAYPELLTGVNASEYEELIDYAIDLGIENGFFQGEGTDSESFIPVFDFEGL
ncbi:radical SAM protein [Butyrivibrio sp. WCD2001]|uniref:radical SAM protein n=1 Tax=Butyrivibrio sp. WCD2001 TaxID=1280681 RepID=UPI000407D09E|nr:radical SAM protein [Butyrivibrio sp. WCD2001]